MCLYNAYHFSYCNTCRSSNHRFSVFTKGKAWTSTEGHMNPFIPYGISHHLNPPQNIVLGGLMFSACQSFPLSFLHTVNIWRFLYPATLKSVGYYAIPSIQKIAFKCPSVYTSELRPLINVRYLFSLAIFGGFFFLPIFFKLGIRVDIEK